MVLFWYKRVRAENFGETTVPVQCAKCGCEYFYELRRVGVGGETAPYMIGSGRATRSALDQSERDLNRRLISEAELVPCPSCNWINDDLVRGYRRGRYQRLTAIAFCISVFGTAGSLIAAGYMSIGPAADRKLLPYVLIGGPALFLTLAAAVVLVRVGLRSLIRPNRKFPEAPKLPRGTPPALLKDRPTGNLKPAKPDVAPPGSPNDWQEFRLTNDDFPPVCCNCTRAAEEGSAYKCTVSKSSAIEIPRCKECAQQARRTHWRIAGLIIVPTLFVINAVAVPMGLDSVQLSMLNGFSLLPLFALADFFGPWAAAPVRTSSRDISRGIVHLRFRNREYADLLAKHLRDSQAV
jgi:hypothetical protein